MQQALWVSMPILRNIIMGAAGNATGLQQICAQGNINPADLDNADLKLTLAQNCALMEAALTISKDPDLGLHIGEKTTQVVLGVTGYLMESSRDIQAALQNLQEFTRSFTRLYDFRLELSATEAIYYCEPIEIWNNVSPDTARHSVDIAFAGALHIIRLLTGKSLQPLKLMYRYSRIANTQEHERILKCRPAFNQPANCIVFALQDMQLPVIGYNQSLNKIFRDLLEKTLQEQHDSNFVAQVKQLILQNYQFEFPVLEEVAQLLNLTPRTLQRKLQLENASFRSVSDAIREELACSLLQNKALTISEIAYKLGYADPATFQRAFRQWTGKTPGTFRQGD